MRELYSSISSSNLDKSSLNVFFFASYLSVANCGGSEEIFLRTWRHRVSVMPQVPYSPFAFFHRRKDRRRIVLREKGNKNRVSVFTRFLRDYRNARIVVLRERKDERDTVWEREREEISPVLENSISSRCNFCEAGKATRAVTCSRNDVCYVDTQEIWDPSLGKPSRADVGNVASTGSAWGVLWNFKFRYYEWGIYGLFRALEILSTWILWRNSRREVELPLARDRLDSPSFLAARNLRYVCGECEIVFNKL